jgi:hypothetical protein
MERCLKALEGRPNRGGISHEERLVRCLQNPLAKGSVITETERAQLVRKAAALRSASIR